MTGKSIMLSQKVKEKPPYPPFGGYRGGMRQQGLEPRNCSHSFSTAPLCKGLPFPLTRNQCSSLKRCSAMALIPQSRIAFGRGQSRGVASYAIVLMIRMVSVHPDACRSGGGT